MTQRIYTDRSRYLTYQTCPRKRWLEYHAGPKGRGWEPARRSWHLVLGAAVHEGLAILLANARTVMNGYIVQARDSAGGEYQLRSLGDLENWAVAVAQTFYDRETASGLAMDQQEMAAADPGGKSLTALLQESLLTEDMMFGMPIRVHPDIPPGQIHMLATPEPIESQSSYTLRELRALTEAMVRAYARRRLPELLAEFDVLEVEREGEWRVGSFGEWKPDDEGVPYRGDDWELWFASRPDALLLHRATQTLHIMSFKTTGAWDARKERDAQRDVQGLSEGVEVERRLAGWWQMVRKFDDTPNLGSVTLPSGEFLTGPLLAFLKGLSAPPRIHAIRYEYLLKGTRKQEDRGSLQGMWTQRTPLLRGYFNAKSGEWAHSWTYFAEDELGTSVKKTLPWASWKGAPTWDEKDCMGGVAVWLDQLDRGVIQPSAGDILAAQFPAPITVYRGEDDLRDWLEQVEAQETRVARAVEDIAHYPETMGQQRSFLNQLFPMFRRSCSYPFDCQFVPVCFGGGDAESTGLYRERVPNHPQEDEHAGN